jgi:hypothetical protein
MKSGIWNTIVVLVLLSLIGIVGVVAQTSDPEVSGLVGTWRAQITARNCETGQELLTLSNYLSFAQGGTVIVMSPANPSAQSPSLGFWQQTGENTYHAMFEAYVFDADGAWIQTHRVTRDFEIGEDPDAWSGDATAESFDRDGNLVLSLCASAIGQRMK